MAIDVLAEFVGLHAVNTIIVQNSAQRMKSSYKCMIRLMYWICGIIMFLKSNTYIYMWCASITVQSLYFTPDNSNPRNLSVPTLAAWFPWFLSCNFWQKKTTDFPYHISFFFIYSIYYLLHLLASIHSFTLSFFSSVSDTGLNLTRQRVQTGHTTTEEPMWWDHTLNHWQAKSTANDQAASKASNEGNSGVTSLDWQGIGKVGVTTVADFYTPFYAL